MDSKLRQIAGYRPRCDRRAGSGSGVAASTFCRFPWLNIGFNPSGYRPPETAPFMEWLEGEHPEAGGPDVRGELFRMQGQELIQILTPESLDLLAGYLEEYERSITGQ